MAKKKKRRDDEPSRKTTREAARSAPGSTAPEPDVAPPGALEEEPEAGEASPSPPAAAPLEAAAGEGAADAPLFAGAEGEGEEGAAATQLGIDRYVMAGYFAAGIVGAYLVGRVIQTLWTSLSNVNWVTQNLPRFAAVPEDEQTTYGMVVGAVVSLVVVLRAYRDPEIRTWSDGVSSELAKVKWPTKKEVTSSTMIVLAASAFATVYLTLLDRFWGFVTNIVYGT